MKIQTITFESEQFWQEQLYESWPNANIESLGPPYIELNATILEAGAHITVGQLLEEAATGKLNGHVITEFIRIRITRRTKGTAASGRWLEKGECGWMNKKYIEAVKDGNKPYQGIFVYMDRVNYKRPLHAVDVELI